jgi:cytochrome P450
MTASAGAARRLREIRELPGPRGLPVVGNLRQVRLAHVHQDVEAWARRYGPYFRFRFGPVRLLGVAGHEDVLGVLKARPDVFQRDDRTTLIGKELGLTPGLFASEGEDWRHQRRMVMAGFMPGRVNAYFPMLCRVVRRLEGRWRAAARRGDGVPLQADLMRYTVDGVAGLAFGRDINTLESDEEVIQRHLDQIFPALFRRAFAVVPYWRWLKLPRDRALDRSVQAVNRAIAGFIAEARDRLARDPARRAQPDNLLEAMIVAADEGGSGVDDRHVAGNVLTLLLAGEDTTAHTIAWMIDRLWRHPEALQRAAEEVRRVAPDPATFTPEQIESLVYLDACAKETMRLKPVAPFIPFQALRDTVIGDVRVPAGTNVWCLMRHDSVSEPHVAEPQRFDPGRWLGDRAAGSPMRIAMPFGAGARVCPGRHLAMIEIKLALAMLLGRFEIEHCGPARGGETAEHMSFSMSPEALSMRLRERGPLRLAEDRFAPRGAERTTVHHSAGIACQGTPQ